jgi:sigma-70-like protein
VSQALAAKAIKTALEKLPERQRMVLILREIEGMSYSAIAEMAGTNVRGVEATLRRARARFRMAIADAEASEGRSAVCKQTLRLIANDTAKAAVAIHLDDCAYCKQRSEKIRAADRAFGLLPPLAFARPSWLGKVVGLAPKPARQPRSFLQSLRGGAEVGFLGPVSQILQAITSVALTGALSASSALGGAARIAVVVNGSPPPEVTTIEQLAASVDAPAHPQPPPSHPVVAATDLTYDHRLQQGAPETKDDSVILDTPATGVTLNLAALPIKTSISINSNNLSAAIKSLTPTPISISANLPSAPLPTPTIPKIPYVSATIASVLPRRKFHLT